MRGTRLSVGDVLGTLAAGCTEAELLQDFPQLTHEDVLADLEFAAEREKRLIERFPGSTHVRLIGLDGASDTAIREWASQQCMVLVTKDEDFLGLSVARGIASQGGVPGDRQRRKRDGGDSLAPAVRRDRALCSAP